MNWHLFLFISAIGYAMVCIAEMLIEYKGRNAKRKRDSRIQK